MGLVGFVIGWCSTQHLPTPHGSPLCCGNPVDREPACGGAMQSDLPSNGETRRIPLSTSAVSVGGTPNEITVSVEGELDMTDADRVGDVLAQAAAAGRPIVRVELSKLTFADSSAVKALLVGAKAAEGHGVTYLLVNPHGNVRRLLAVTGLDEALTVVTEPEYQEGPNSA
jgi:anti-sigma B factor antagonist